MSLYFWDSRVYLFLDFGFDLEVLGFHCSLVWFLNCGIYSVLSETYVCFLGVMCVESLSFV